MIRRIWNSIGKDVKNARYQDKAVEFFEKVDKGKKTITAAPRHKSEEKHIAEALRDEELKKKVAEKDEKLVGNMTKFNIKSTDPPERWTTSKKLPTRETEFMHRDDRQWEYAFHEIEPEKVPKNKLMFREALEVLRARQELDEDSYERPPHPQDADTLARMAKHREIMSETLEKHPAIARVEPHLIDQMYEYFRPFARKDTQKVVLKKDVMKLQELMHGMGEMHATAKEKEQALQAFRGLISRNKAATATFDKLNEKEQLLIAEAARELKRRQEERLAKHLGEMEQIEKAQAEAEAAVAKEKAEAEEKKLAAEAKEQKPQ